LKPKGKSEQLINQTNRYSSQSKALSTNPTSKKESKELPTRFKSESKQVSSEGNFKAATFPEQSFPKTQQEVAYDNNEEICPNKEDTRVTNTNLKHDIFENTKTGNKTFLQEKQNVQKGRAVMSTKQLDVSEHTNFDDNSSEVPKEVLDLAANDTIHNDNGGHHNNTNTSHATEFIEVEMDPKFLTIEGKINGQDYKFLCDSGAALTSISKNV